VWITSLNSHFPHQEPQHQMLKRKKAEPKTPHFLSLNQDIVPWSQDEKCGLKYVMHSPAKVVECCGENLETSTVFVHSIKYAGLIRIFCLG